MHPAMGIMGLEEASPVPPSGTSGPFPMLPLSPPDTATHKAALSASSSPSPPIWLLSLPGTRPVPRCSARTLFLYLSLGMGPSPPVALLWLTGRSWLCPGPEVMGMMAGSPLHQPWNLSTSWGPVTQLPPRRVVGAPQSPPEPAQHRGAPFLMAQHSFTSCFPFPMPAGLCCLRFTQEGSPNPMCREPYGRGGEVPGMWLCSLAQNWQWLPNLGQWDVPGTMPPTSLSPERGICPNMAISSPLPAPSHLGKALGGLTQRHCPFTWRGCQNPSSYARHGHSGHVLKGGGLGRQCWAWAAPAHCCAHC